MSAKKKQLKAIKDAIREVWGPEIATDDVLERSVYLPEDDRGGWAPYSEAVINFECGLPGNYEPDMIEAWMRVSDKVQEKGYPIYLEFINGAVGAFYPC